MNISFNPLLIGKFNLFTFIVIADTFGHTSVILFIFSSLLFALSALFCILTCLSWISNIFECPYLLLINNFIIIGWIKKYFSGYIFIIDSHERNASFSLFDANNLAQICLYIIPFLLTLFLFFFFFKDFIYLF